MKLQQSSLPPAVAQLCLVRCMSRTLPVALAAALILSSCHKETPLPETSPDAEPLRWLDQADVVTDFTARVENQHDMRFVSIYALSASGAVGLDDTPEVRELIRRHGERHIEG